MNKFWYILALFWVKTPIFCRFFWRFFKEIITSVPDDELLPCYHFIPSEVDLFRYLPFWAIVDDRGTFLTSTSGVKLSPRSEFWPLGMKLSLRGEILCSPLQSSKE
jgi:hypothetical protein